MNWRRILVILVISVFILLDWAALDDITTGNEPNYWGEYAILLVSAAIFAYLLWRKIRR